MHYNRYPNSASTIRPSYSEYSDYSYYTPHSRYYQQTNTQPPPQRRNDFQYHYDRPGPSKNPHKEKNKEKNKEKVKDKSNFVPCANTNPNPFNDDYKSYVCPGCSLHYDCLSRNNRYMGRVPLVLNCHHTLCQECIYKGAVVDNIKCPICKQTSEITKKHLVDNVQEVFPPNYYLFGLIMWAKPFGNNCRQPILVPTHGTLANRKLASAEQIEDPNDTEEICCFLSCNKLAVLRCRDCNDIYCVDCCTVIHKSAKSMWCHTQVEMSKEKFSAELEQCPQHNMDVELFCRTCDANVCCYCFLEKHEGHKREFLFKLNEIELNDFRTYKEKAEKILRQLLISQKRLKTLCSSGTTAVENKICTYFANLHADLYLVQKRLQKRVATLDGVGKTDSGLDSIGSSLSRSINIIKNLLISADSVSQKKMNLRGLLRRLTEVQTMPCYLLTEDGNSADPIEFKVDPILKNTEELFEISLMEDCKFALVAEDELPADYVIDPTDESDVESCISSMLSSIKKDDVSFSGRSIANTTVSNASKPAPHKRNSKLLINSHLQLPLDNEMVEVTHIESLECFYVRLKKAQSRFNQMNKDIDNYIKIGASPVEYPQMNEMYLVMYATKKEKTWCRGRVTDIKSEGKKAPMYEVFFVDYGSTQIVPVEKLREITPSISQKKAFAIQCELYNPTFASWGKNAHVYMGKMINGKNVYMLVKNVNNGIYQVDLMVSSSDKGLTSIIDILIHTCANALSTSSDSSSVASQKKEIFLPECKIFSNSIKFRRHQVENVVLANVVDPHHIFVHISAYVDSLRKMTSEMKHHYKNAPSESCIPVEGSYVAVEYRDVIRGAWHRALVKKVDVNTAKAHVLLVDWGNNVVVPWSCIRMLSDTFTRLESQAVLVKLAHVEMPDSQAWSEKAVFFLQKNLRSQDTLKMIVHKDDPLEVALFESSGTADICINAQLVEEKLAVSTGKISRTLVWPQNEEGQPDFNEDEGFVATLLKRVDETIDGLSEEEEEEVTALGKQQIEVVKMVSPDLIHIKFPNMEHQEQQLHKELQIYYQKERETREVWHENEDCVVIFGGSYVRGKILGGEAGKYRVNVYDKATETVLATDKIFEYSDYFRKYPNVVFKSHLANVRPAGGDRWSLTSVEALERIFEKHKDIYGTRVKGDVSRKSMPMLMWYALVEVGGALEPSVTKFVSVNGLLVKMGMAYKVSTIKSGSVGVAREPEAGQVEVVSALVHAADDGSDRGLDDSVSTVDGSVKGEEEQDGNSETKDKPLLDSSDQTNSSSRTNTSNPTTTSSVGWVELIDKELEEEQAEEEEKKKEDSPYHTQKTEIVDWKPPFPIKKREFNAWITCAETEGILYLRDEDLQIVYKDMEANLKLYFDSQPPVGVRNRGEWRPGQICTICYKDYWYRGKILKVNGPEEIVAVMIDFGSDHVLGPEQLYREILYPEIPAFASRIKLDGLFAVSGTWLDSDYEMLLEKITEYAKVVIKGSLDVETPLAEVFLSTGESINQVLANLCPNLTRSPSLKTEIIEEETVVIEKEEPLAETLLGIDRSVEKQLVDTDTDDLDFKIEPLPVDALDPKVAMSIVAILSYNRVVLKKPAESEDELYVLSEKIQESYATQPVLEEIKPGMPCICPFSDDGVWYRAKVHNIDGIDCGYIFVFYVDFGNVESVSTKDIRMMKPEWFELPISCYIATLNFELRTDNHVEHVWQHIKKLYEKIKLVEVVEEDPLTVNLYEENGELCYQSLVKGGLLKIK